ncbi:TPA: hypothetical protein RUV22_002851 [Staphylococcus aureus]|nr:hypothetical protein [Staphylococcus aureus]HDZ8674054.1 hypothetical protein [Staphylococcus aureus]HDZ8753519.1 hypothetical protein [Staphylococcus aureus]HDZ8782800.1 hypothetical protein [Staphylococcus aureus]
MCMLCMPMVMHKNY